MSIVFGVVFNRLLGLGLSIFPRTENEIDSLKASLGFI